MSDTVTTSAPPQKQAPVVKSADTPTSQGVVATALLRKATMRQPHTTEGGTTSDTNLKDDDGGKSSGAGPKGTSQDGGNGQGEQPPQKVEPPKTEIPDTSKLPDGRNDWKAEASKHQSRADKAEAEVQRLMKEAESYKESKQLVDDFTKDPVSFVKNRLPDLAQQLVNSGDPVKMIESETSKYAKDLITEFKKNYGED